MKATRRAVLLGAAAATAAPKVWASPRLSYGLTPKRVADGVWMIEGAPEYFSFENGGNIVNTAIIETAEGAVIVDTGPSRRYGEELRKVVIEAVPLGIAAVFNSHQHPDHWFGNQVFADERIIALPEAKAQMAMHGDAYSDALYRLLGDWMRGTEPMAPNEDFAGGDIEIGGRGFSVIPFSGHTAADMVVFDKTTGTMIAGDLAFLDRAPTTPDADMTVWQDSLSLMAAMDPSGIVPGHGPFDPALRSLDQTGRYLEWLDGALQKAAEDGLDMVETMQGTLPDWVADLGAQPTEFERSVSHLFGAYELGALPKVN